MQTVLGFAAIVRPASIIKLWKVLSLRQSRRKFPIDKSKSVDKQLSDKNKKKLNYVEEDVNEFDTYGFSD